MENKIVLTVDEACYILGIGRDLMLRLVRVKGFPSVRLRKKILINRSKLLMWLDENSNGNRILI